ASDQAGMKTAARPRSLRARNSSRSKRAVFARPFSLSHSQTRSTAMSSIAPIRKNPRREKQQFVLEHGQHLPEIQLCECQGDPLNLC
ncbi:hypothetical protein, partial [Erythrobacter sp.]|nr:hypothetical protein [Erythrobacter sp.]